MAPLDLSAYQVNDEYLPDKEALWNHKPEESGWTLAHNALRSEMTTFLEALAAVKSQGALKEWQIKAIQTVFEGHFTHIHGHHENEDDILAPEVQKRFKYPEVSRPLEYPCEISQQQAHLSSHRLTWYGTHPIIPSLTQCMLFSKQYDALCE